MWIHVEYGITIGITDNGRGEKSNCSFGDFPFPRSWGGLPLSLFSLHDFFRGGVDVQQVTVMERDVPWEDSKWMQSRAARPLRLLAEYIEPRDRLEMEGVHDTIVFFGSARLEADHPDALAAMELSERLTAWAMVKPEDGGGAHPDGTQRFHVTSGGGPGVMEAANRGARIAGGRSVGLGIELPTEEGLNEEISPELALNFRYFAMRKFWFVYLAKAIICFPGGYGTLDELFEVLTLLQTGKIQRALPIYLWNSNWWNQIINWNLMLENGTISADDLNFFEIHDDLDEMFTALITHLSGLPDEPASAP